MWPPNMQRKLIQSCQSIGENTATVLGSLVDRTPWAAAHP